jgi:predicted SnoaL-like aldol condensation-catalyzing enzyme
MSVITEVRRVTNDVENISTEKGSKRAKIKTTDVFCKCDNGKVYRVKPEYWNSIQKYQTMENKFIQH